jgi:transcriptional regulator with XRE-family HTH domain/Zn-dependent peptidase ImmA (M78 family)
MSDEHQSQIGRQIARLREQQGWSQRALAKWVGIDQSAVSRIEAGRRRLSADELQRLARALHVSADALLSGDRPALAMSVPAAPAPARLASRDWGELGATDETETGVMPALGPPAPFAAPAMRMASPDVHGVALQRPSEREVTARLDDAGDASDDTPDVRAAATSAPGLPHLAGLPREVAGVARDWLDLRLLAGAGDPAQPWSMGHSAEGKPERVARSTPPVHGGTPAGGVLHDRVARFWRSELHVAPDDGPLPDLVPLLEDGYGAQVIVARTAADRPVAAAFAADGIPFLFVNAGRPVVLQRFALAHAFAHLVLGHGDVVDRRIEWSRTVPPEAAANDFAEELLAPVRAVQRWFERRTTPRPVRLEDLLDLGNAFGVSAWAALYRSRAAGWLQGKQFNALRAELHRHEWELLPRQAYLGGLKDTLTQLTPHEALAPGAYGGPAVLRVPARMRAWALVAVGRGRLSLEDAAAALHVDARAFAEELARLGLE